MKTIIIGAIFFTSLTACKKDYYCECRQAGVVTAKKTYHDIKIIAKNKCNGLDQTYYETSCGLK